MLDPISKDKFDFAAEWKKGQIKLNKPDDKQYWNNRAHTFRSQAGISSYCEQFIELCRFDQEDRVFDMGSGSGTLAVPLAKLGHEVVASDFSENMLSYLKAYAEEEAVSDKISIIQASWEDDWDKLGIPKCDVAIASRSIMALDLEECLLKLESKAKKRCCITLSTGDSPRFDPRLYEEIGRAPTPGGDFIYAMNILWQLGREPELTYIRSTKMDMYESEDVAREHIAAPLVELSEEEQSALEVFFEKHLKSYTDGDGVLRWGRDYTVQTCWAFICWDVA